MKNHLSHLLMCLLLTISIGASAQAIDDTSRIVIKPNNGHLVYYYQDTMRYEAEIIELLESSEDPTCLKELKKYKRRNCLMQINLTIGLSAGIIWILNEIFNDEFHSDLPGAGLWRTIVIGPSLLCNSAAILSNRSSKRKLNKAIEAFND